MQKCIVLEAVTNAMRVMIALMYRPLVGAVNLKDYAIVHVQAEMALIQQ